MRFETTTTNMVRDWKTGDYCTREEATQRLADDAALERAAGTQATGQVPCYAPTRDPVHPGRCGGG